MERILNLEKFNDFLINCNSIDEEEVIVRKIIEMCSKDYMSNEEFEYVFRQDLKLLEMAKNDISQDLSKIKIAKDMIIGEYCNLNLISASPDNSEEEVY